MGEYVHYLTVRQSANVSLPKGKYRAHVIGAGGGGGGDVYASTRNPQSPEDLKANAGGGTGGSSGAYAIHDFELPSAQDVSVSIDSSRASLSVGGHQVIANSGVRGKRSELRRRGDYRFMGRGDGSRRQPRGVRR